MYGRWRGGTSRLLKVYIWRDFRGQIQQTTVKPTVTYSSKECPNCESRVTSYLMDAGCEEEGPNWGWFCHECGLHGVPFEEWVKTY